MCNDRHEREPLKLDSWNNSSTNGIKLGINLMSLFFSLTFCLLKLDLYGTTFSSFSVPLNVVLNLSQIWISLSSFFSGLRVLCYAFKKCHSFCCCSFQVYGLLNERPLNVMFTMCALQDRSSRTIALLRQEILQLQQELAEYKQVTDDEAFFFFFLK